MKFSKTLALLMVGMGFIALSGCGDSFGRTGEERAHMYKSVSRSEWKMAKDDVDSFNMVERRSRLTRWH